MSTLVRAAVVLALLNEGCGRKGPPLPPQWVIPDPPPAVLAEDAPTGLRLTWKRPRAYADGSPLDDLELFEIQRACDVPGEFSSIGTVRLIDRDRFRKETTFSAVDIDAPRGSDCRYRVIAVTSDGYRSPPAESASVRRPVVDPAR